MHREESVQLAQMRKYKATYIVSSLFCKFLYIPVYNNTSLVTNCFDRCSTLFPTATL